MANDTASSVPPVAQVNCLHTGIDLSPVVAFSSWLAPTAVTYGDDAGNDAWSDLSVQSSSVLPLAPLSPEATNRETPLNPIF